VKIWITLFIPQVWKQPRVIIHFAVLHDQLIIYNL